MIYTEMKGRLGNQLFKYAFSRKIQIARNRNEKMVFSFNNMIGRDPNDGWEDALKYFKTKEYFHYEGKGHVVMHKSSFLQRIVAAALYFSIRIIAQNDRYKRINIIYKWEPILNKVGLLIVGEHYYEPDIPGTKDVFIDGPFQSKKYFDDIRDLLLVEFTPKKPPLKSNDELYAVINNSNSICVSIRRGDYVTNPEFEKIYNICSAEYFKKATDIIKSKIDNPTFIIFSDDIEWAKQNINLGADTYYESGNDPVWEKLRLMYSCKHFIISNSSFSWWAQYLGRYKDKIVISPSRWYNNEFPSYLIDDNWIQIDT